VILECGLNNESDSLIRNFTEDMMTKHNVKLIRVNSKVNKEIFVAKTHFERARSNLILLEGNITKSL